MVGICLMWAPAVYRTSKILVLPVSNRVFMVLTERIEGRGIHTKKSTHLVLIARGGCPGAVRHIRETITFDGLCWSLVASH